MVEKREQQSRLQLLGARSCKCFLKKEPHYTWFTVALNTRLGPVSDGPKGRGGGTDLTLRSSPPLGDNCGMC